MLEQVHHSAAFPIFRDTKNWDLLQIILHELVMIFKHNGDIKKTTSQL
jgi:hypothetical protein